MSISGLDQYTLIFDRGHEDKKVSRRKQPVFHFRVSDCVQLMVRVKVYVFWRIIVRRTSNDLYCPYFSP